MASLFDPPLVKHHIVERGPPASCLLSEILLLFSGCNVQTLFWKVLDPVNPWRLRWDYVLLSSLIYVIVVTPFYIAFYQASVSLDQALQCPDYSFPMMHSG